MKKLNGKAEASRMDPIQLNDGIITAVQQLQTSGHAKAGFRGFTQDGIEVVVPKPKETRVFEETPDPSQKSEEVDVKISTPDTPAFPFHESHVTSIRTTIRKLTDSSN